MRLLFLFLITGSLSYAQQDSFEGKMVYSIEMTDTALAGLFDIREMTLYTNDTLVRVENTTDQLGNQVAIKHLLLHKSYLLLDTPVGKFAIQTKQENDSVPISAYTFKKKFGKKKIAGIRAKKLEVYHEGFKEPMYFYYSKKHASNYLEGFENFPGLLVEYYIPTPDGIYCYTLKSLENQATPKDLYGVPSDYQRVTMSEFIEMMTAGAEE